MSWLDRLQDHPFDVDARFDFSLVLTWALPIEVLQPLLPPMLQVDTFDDAAGRRQGFLAVAMVQTRGLRPSRLPPVFGRDFFLIGTRIFARCTLTSGQRLRGLSILRSQTNRAAMRVLGDRFTRYRYETIDIDVVRTDDRITVSSGDFLVDVDTASSAAVGTDDDSDHGDPDTALLPAGSPFTTWKQARRFAGPMPYTFSAVAGRDDEVLVVEGVRSQWHPRAVRVREQHVPFFAERGLPGAVLASAFLVEDVPYHWKAGRRERCPTPSPA